MCDTSSDTHLLNIRRHGVHKWSDTPPLTTYYVCTGDVPIIILITLCVLAALFVCIVNSLQYRRPHYLPVVLRTWLWLPEPLRSLRPYDQYIFKPLGESLTKCCSCAKDNFKSKHSGGAALSDVKFNTRERTADANELAVAAQRMA